jgi:hypothetical protein
MPSGVVPVDESDTHEYVIASYDPAPATASLVKRVHATLGEVAQQVALAIAAIGNRIDH